jgi:hypothetical protein
MKELRIYDPNLDEAEVAEEGNYAAISPFVISESAGAPQRKTKV